MKNSFQLIGTIGGAILFAGVIFKSQHWPGASILLTVGAILSIIFFALLLINEVSSIKNPLEKSAVLFFGITMIIVILGFIFKVMHWPGAAVMIIIAHTGLFVASILLIIDANKEKDKQKQSFKALTGVSVFILMTILLFLGVATGAVPI